MPIETWLIFTLIIMIIGSIVAIELKNLLSAIIAIGIVGLGTSICFLFLQAPDLAIVQFLFEIFAIIILVRAFIKTEYHHMDRKSGRVAISIITVIILAGVLVLSLDMFEALPEFGEPTMETAKYYVENAHAAHETHSANLVTSIILDYRAYDTLGEITVLFTAILGALTIIRIKSGSGKEEEDAE
jgi:multisubunit Na+/H+ antiporter MnhB subunit